MTSIVFHDDGIARGFEPFALTRPVASLVAGVMPIAARWAALGVTPAGFLAADHLALFEENGLTAAVEPRPGTIVANSRFAPSLGATLKESDDVWTSGGHVVAVRLKRSVRSADLHSGAIPLETIAGPGAHMAELEGWWLAEVWDLLRHLPQMLASDIEHFARAASGKVDPPDHSVVLGEHPVIAYGATIEPHVVFDASAGPILVDVGAHVHAFTRIAGPCYIGRNSNILGGDILACSIGPVSKIRGEISGTVVAGYSNKGHEGFVGSSYLGQWVNLGAGTTTSNLKNTYGAVALWTPTGIRPTGMQFLGTLFGDHVKTGIGLMLTTGTVLGAGANVYGSAMPPKAVAPFSWGDSDPYDLYQIDKFLASTEKVMARRKVTLTERMKEQLRASFEQRWSAE